MVMKEYFVESFAFWANALAANTMIAVKVNRCFNFFMIGIFYKERNDLLLKA